MMRQNFLSALILVVGNCGALFAAGIQGNYYADQNREVFLLPRSAAMAGSDIALFRSAGPLGNPANLPADSLKEASLAYAGYFQNTYSTAGLTYIGPVDSRSSIGVSASYILVPGIELHPDTSVAGNERMATGSDFFFRVSYGRKLLELGDRIEVNAGAALNGERHDDVDWTGYGIGMDAGANITYKLEDIGSKAALGLIIENLTTSYTDWSAGYKEFAYPHARVGLGWQSELTYLYGRLSVSYLSPDLFSNEGINSYQTASADLNSSVQVPEFKRVATNPAMLILAAHAGVEYTIMNRISFRVGIYNGSPSFGAGLHLMQDRAGFDFAYISNDLAPAYKLSVNFRWL